MKEFWRRYRRSPQGMIGLFIFLFFLFLAVFSFLLTSYHPLRDRYLADRMARPVWMQIFPKYRDMPRTVDLMTTARDWEISGEPGIEAFLIKHEEAGVITFLSAEKGRGEEKKLLLEQAFLYEQTPPRTFVLTMQVKPELPENLSGHLALDIINPAGEIFALWSEEYTGARARRPVRIDSRDQALKRRLQLSPFAEVTEEIFTGTGEYKLRLTATFAGEEDLLFPQNGRLEIENLNLRILGRLHGVLGVDHLGTDLWSQLVYGARISLMIGILSAFIAVVIGTGVGILSGYTRGVVDEFLMRVADVMLSIPTLPILIILAGLLGKSVWNIVILVAVFTWMGPARIVRSQTLSLKERSFVEVARASGAGDIYIMLKHILPNVLPLVFASMVLLIPVAIIYEATLSFLGLGDPMTATWGRMLHNARGFGAFTELAWWWILPPGLSITFLSLSFVLIGNTVDDILNPKHRERS